MRKRIFFSLAAVLCALCALAQHQDGDYVYTSDSRYKLLGTSIFDPQASTFRSEDGFGGWRQLAGSADYAEYTDVGEGVLTWTNALATNGIVGTVDVVPGNLYVVTFTMYNDDEPFSTTTSEGSKNRIQIVANATGDETISSVEGEVSEVSSASINVGTTADGYAIALQVDSVWNTKLSIVFAGLPASTHITNVEVWQAVKVYNTRLLEEAIDYAQTLIDDDNFSANAEALAFFKTESFEPVVSMLANNLELFDDESTGQAAIALLNEGIEAYLEASAPVVNELFKTTIGNSTYTGFDFANWSSYGRGGVNATGPNTYFQGGNWGHLTSGDFSVDASALTSRIQSGYNSYAAFNAYNTDFPAGKYFFTAEMRAANGAKGSWPCNPSYSIESDCQYFINGEVMDVTVSGLEWTKVYMVAEVPEGDSFHAGVFWKGPASDNAMEVVAGQNTVNITEGSTKNGGTFDLRNVQIRAFDGIQLKADINRKNLYNPFKEQYDAIVNARAALLEVQSDKATYPYNRDSLQQALDKWDPYYNKMVNNGWVGNEGEDTKVATDEELTNFVKFQGVWTTPEDTVDVTDYTDYPLSRGYQNAVSYVKNAIAHFETLALSISTAKDAMSDPIYSNGDMTTLQNAIDDAENIYNTTYAGATDETFDADRTNVLIAAQVMDEATAAFKKSAEQAPFLAFYFDQGYTEVYGEPDFETGEPTIAGYEIPASTGDYKMTFASATAFSPDNASGTKGVYVLGNGDSNLEVLRVGASEVQVDFSSANITADECLRVEFDIWPGKLSGKYLGVGVKNAEGDRLGGFSYNFYNGIVEYNDFGVYDEAGAFVEGSGMNPKQFTNNGNSSDGDILVQKANNHVVLIYDVKAQTIIGEFYSNGATSPTSGNVTSFTPLTMVQNSNGDFMPAVFYLTSTYMTNGRRCWFDNLTMLRYESQAEVTGINEITSKNDAADSNAIFNLSGMRVGNDYKGIVVVNGKKVIK